MNSFYSIDELKNIGFSKIGSNVLISKKSSIYSPHLISIGDNVRIDDFCILSGNITLMDYIHIAAYSALYGGLDGIFIDSFSNISSKVSIYSISDDYSGTTMTNPMVPDKYKNVLSRSVTINKHVIIGTGSTILPGVTIGIGVAIGAMSFVNKSLEPWNIYAGVPAKYIKNRQKNLLDLEKVLMGEKR